MVYSPNMISYVYFDVGGVALLDFSGTTKWYQMKRAMGFSDEQIPQFDALWKDHIASISKGELSLPQFTSLCAKEFRNPTIHSFPMLDYFVDHFETNPSIWPVIKKIHATHKVGLLTNMYIDMFNEISKKQLLPNEQWDHIIDSSIIHKQKPDRDIYEYAQQIAHVPHNEILFIDNQEINLVEPQKLGWTTFWYDSKNPITSSKALEHLFESL